jgi:hypothetical protein
MMDSIALDWVLAVLVLVIVGSLLYQLVVQVPRERLMRCPEQGVITFIEVKPAPPGDAHPFGVTVQHCGLWGDKKGCSEGCLERYSEPSPGFHIDRHALRAYDR